MIAQQRSKGFIPVLISRWAQLEKALLGTKQSLDLVLRSRELAADERRKKPTARH